MDTGRSIGALNLARWFVHSLQVNLQLSSKPHFGSTLSSILVVSTTVSSMYTYALN